MKSVFLVASALFSLAATAASVHPSCITAYEDARAGKLNEAATKMAECGASVEKPTLAHTVVLYDRVKVLDRLGRPDEALAQMVALTYKAHFETGLADEFSGPGAWTRDPEKIKQRQATGISRTDLLLDIARRLHQTGRYKEAIVWAERSARHALNRFRPEGEFFPMDREAGCAIALRGFARSAIDQDKSAAWADLARGYIRGCDSLPVGREIAKLDEDLRQEFAELKRNFETLQSEVTRVTASIRDKAKDTAKASAARPEKQAGIPGMSMLTDSLERKKAVEPVLVLRDRFLTKEAVALEVEALFDEKSSP